MTSYTQYRTDRASRPGESAPSHLRSILARGVAIVAVDHPSLPSCAGSHNGGREQCDGRRGKHPIKPKTVRRGESALRLFNGEPRNYSIDTGNSGLVVLDSDKPGAIDRLASDLGISLPDTFTVLTAQDRHLYYRTTTAPDVFGHDVVKSQVLKQYGIDIKADAGPSGLVIGPGSLHASGATYTPIDADAPFAQLPEELYSYLIERQSKSAPPSDTGVGMPQTYRYLDAPKILDVYGITTDPGNPRRPVREAFDTDIRDIDGDRFRTQWRLMCACFEFGMDTEEVFAVAYQAGCNKFTNRPASLWSQVQKAARYVRGKEVTDMTGARVNVNTMPRGQTRLAMRFAEEHSGALRFVHGLGWHVWTGTHWAPDTVNRPMNLAIQTVTDARMEAATLGESERKALWTDAATCNGHSGLRGLLGIAESIEPIATSVDALDPDPYLFNTRNGTIDLRTGELLPHDRSDCITNVAGCGYNPNAEGPTFLRFLGEILPDPEVRDFVQRLVGYAMLGTVKEHVLPLFIGPGRNGKSKLLEVVLKAFGDYGLMAAPTLLIEKGSNSATTDKVDLLGRRIVVCSETDEGNRFASATVKDLTGGDIVTGRKLYRDFVRFAPAHTIFLMTNHEPKTDGSDSAMFERLRKVSFEQRFTGARQDPDLSTKLSAELDVVLRWAVDGYRKYVKRGLKPPTKVIEDTERYQLSNDPVGSFLKDCTIESETAVVGSEELYQAWNSWGGSKMSQKAFSGRIERRGYAKKRSAKGQRFVGIGLLKIDTDGDSAAAIVTES